MINTPKSGRLHIGIFGRRNVGKSSLLNVITRQEVAVVSEVAGTTTDPVEKPMELQPIGPVVFIDTAGIDDIGALGEKRIAQTIKVLERTDVGIIVTAENIWDNFECMLLTEMKARAIPVLVVINKSDIAAADENFIRIVAATECSYVAVSALQNNGIDGLKAQLCRLLPEEFLTRLSLVGDLVRPGDLVMLVVPIDMEAPKGRLILPQQQTIRDVLDNDASCMMVKERELKEALTRLKEPPTLVVTDSQAFLKVSADTPPEIPLTSFSILLGRNKGDLLEFVRGAMAIDSLRPGDRILLCEACTHHPIGDDIGRVKIPRWIRQYAGMTLEFDHYQGHDFPVNLEPYRLVIHCGSCMHNRKEMINRIFKCRQAKVPITNYGLIIAYVLGIFPRALEPFPDAKLLYERSQSPKTMRQ